MPIRYSSSSGVPFGTSSDRPSSPSIGQTFYNGTLGVQEIYTSSGWLPATGANDFNVTLTGTVTTATFTKEYFAGAYTIASALLDSTYDIYVYDTSGNLAGYTKSPSLSATGNFNKIVVIGGTTGDLLSFSYKTTFTASATTSQVTAGAFITSTTPTALNSIGNTTTITGGNFATDVAVYFVGSDNVERAAKTVVRNSTTSLTVTRPDNFPTNLGTYKLIVENPGVTRPTGSSLHILNNAITAGTTPNWTTGTTLTEIAKNIAYSTTLVASDTEGTAITYAVQSGTLPAGITLNGSTGVLSGTYTGTDFTTNNLVIRATDTGGNYVDRTFTIFSLNPVWNTSAGLPGYTTNSAYSTTISASDDNTITYSIQSGSLPSGLSLNTSTGVISGTPTSNVNFTATIRATDSVGNYTDRAFTIPVYISMEVLLIGGGASGGYGNQNEGGGGGGAGGILYTTSYSNVIGGGATLALSVGTGGTSVTSGAGNGGSSTTFGSFTALGGGAGGGGGAGSNGGSGGGGGGAGQAQVGGSATQTSQSPFTGYGNSGGPGSWVGNGYGGGGGGGGAGGAGANGQNYTSTGGPGGSGLAYSITGSSVTYAVGGYGGKGQNQNNAYTGTDGSTYGSGGQGNGTGNSSGRTGNGAGGVIIIAYPNTSPAIANIPGTLTYDQPTRSGYRVYRFTAGTGTITF